MTHLQDTAQHPPDKRKQRRARNALSAYLRRLRKACDTFSTANDWVEFVGELNGILQQYSSEIPPANHQALTHAMQLADPTREGIAMACDVLQLEIEKTVNLLPSGGCSCGCLAAAGAGAFAGLLVLVAIGVTAVAFVSRPVEVLVFNGGCEPMLVRQGLPAGIQPVIDLLGLNLPDEIESGEEALFEVPGPPINIGVDARSGRTVGVSVLGFSTQFQVSTDVDFIEVNGEPILGQRHTFGLRDQFQHTVAIFCE